VQHGAAVSVYELPDSLRLPHNVLAPPPGRALAAEMFDLLLELSYGDHPSALVRTIQLSPKAGRAGIRNGGIKNRGG
jgi:hypothetical protein